jgi:hypothetical protein
VSKTTDLSTFLDTTLEIDHLEFQPILSENGFRTEHFWKFYSLGFKLKQKQICGDKAEGMFENDDLD